MSSAFTREQDDENVMPDVGERTVSPHRNLVTKAGLTHIETEIAVAHEELAKAEADKDKQKIALASRDLRYWLARRETAELSEPDPNADVIRFGMWVKLKGEDGKVREWQIVGEDEADAGENKMSHAGALAMALFGKGIGDEVSVNNKNWEIVGVDALDRQA